jgi:hypothetical protein
MTPGRLPIDWDPDTKSIWRQLVSC